MALIFRHTGFYLAGKSLLSFNISCHFIRGYFLSRNHVKLAYSSSQQRCFTLASPLQQFNVEQPRVNTDHVITVPLNLKKRLEKRQIRENTRGHQRLKIINASRQGKKSHVIIYCKEKDYNYYLGQSYGKNEEIPLASKGWGHKKSAGDWFTIRPTTKTSAFGFPECPTVNFEELGVKSNILQRLEDNKAFKPTLIQQIAIPSILKGSNNLVAAETGCGKTLAYLIPMVQQILDEKRRRKKRVMNQPLGIVLVPSRELADQIYYVATKLTEGMGVNVSILQGGNIGSKISNATASDMDLLISTVNIASVLTTAGLYKTNRVDHVVLDEADTLLDDSFSADVLDFLRKFPFHPTADRLVQLTLVSATLPNSIESILGEVVPMESLNRISTPGLHYVMSHVPQTFLRLRKSDKPDKLLEIVKSDLQNNIPITIFCNKTKTCDWMYIFMKENEIPCVNVHGDTRPAIRDGLLDKYQMGEVNVMICTDLGSRGINTVRTGHVLNYEFPSFIADYIHRCGRTGRVGSVGLGKVTNFITRRYEFDVVREIERSVRKELSLSKVNANIKRQLTTRYGMFQPIVDDDYTE